MLDRLVTQSFLLTDKGKKWCKRLSSFRIDNNLSPLNMDVIHTSGDKGITGDERILNKAFLKGF